jgi:pimeloyl-ACP methyl ester carboxylesterase
MPPVHERIGRRQLLLLGGALAGAVAETAPAPAAAPDTHPHLILVHGAWHSSYCWRLIADRLRAMGLGVTAIDLPGHGLNARYPKSYFAERQAGFDSEPTPLGDITLEVAAAAVVAALEQHQGATKPILIGHSLGGAVITRAAEVAPQLVGRLVYLSAFLPTAQPSPAALYALPEARTAFDAALTIGDPAVIGAVRFNPRGNLEYLRSLQSVFYQDITEDRFLPFAGAMSPDLPLRLWTDAPSASAARWGRLKRTYIHCTLDRAIAPALQHRMVEDADRFTPGNRTSVMALASSHSPFASKVDELADALQGLARGGG